MNEAGGGARLLLHVCCGPCAISPLASMPDGMDVTGLFYNPNIHPQGELQRRLAGAVQVFSGEGRALIVMDECAQGEWEAFEAPTPTPTPTPASAPDGPPGPDMQKRARCAMCYLKRLSYTAEAARDGGFDCFSTTLLVSPYQDHWLIKSTCDDLSKKFNVDFYYVDWRPLFRGGQKEARDLGLYRQKYCGCIFSAQGG
ncbi:MAG: epoxyqueuosine reductase QueH [Oscillospiraceae bacterium]|nr:epoxyqueuosine reductase QueH [Oscillospiraceae bacterium]